MTLYCNAANGFPASFVFWTYLSYNDTLGSFLNEKFVCLRFDIGFQIDISLDENVSIMQPKHH